MTYIPMHAEQTADPAVMRWVVRGDVVSGSGVLNSGQFDAALPPEWNTALAAGEIEQIVVTDGELRVRIPEQRQWRDVAGDLQGSLSKHLNEGHVIAVTTEARSDEELAEAVQKLLDGPLASYVASHGGKITLESVVDSVVTVRLIGACKGCASAGSTLKQGIEEQLRENYPEIKQVRSIDDKGSKSNNLAENGRKLLPFVN